jgi:hypothetical protein
LESPRLLHSFWLNRFQIFETEDEYICKDRLATSPVHLPKMQFQQYPDSLKSKAIFWFGFMASLVAIAPLAVGDKPGSVSDNLFWQFPCRTEGAAFDIHQRREISANGFEASVWNVYLGLPWATFIDKKMVDAQAIQIARTQIRGLRGALQELGVRLQVHTVCQHIYWQKMTALWEEIGITDLWLSHCLPYMTSYSHLPFRFHPWRLFAVNIEDVSRCDGVVVGKPLNEKKYIASFIGVHKPHYLSDIRLKLNAFEHEEGFLIRVTTDDWHFEKVVYEHQVLNKSLPATYTIDSTVSDYNRVLSDSVFALCPAGAGPNTLRFWEALAVGAIPVLLGEMPLLPEGGSLEPIEWGSAIVRINDSQLAQLPEILRKFTTRELIAMQAQGLDLFARVSQQTCF